MDKLVEQVKLSIDARRLLRRCQSVLVAVSGGPDSMALLHILHQLSAEYSWRIAVAHLNHGLRGRSSDADERLVIRTAKQLGLRIVTERVEVKTFAATGKLSLEMAARKLRHDFLARTARRLKVSTVALAHHADDQVELFFLRLLRGSGNEGLAGMKWRNRSSSDPRLELVRPLLEVSKDALLSYAARNRIPFREDASNDSLDIQRNRIRKELLPLLKKKYQPAIHRLIPRVMEIANGEAECVGQLAMDWLESKTPGPFHQLPKAVQRRCVQLQLRRAKLTEDFGLIESLRMSPGTPVSISPRESVLLDGHGRMEVIETKPVNSNSTQLEVELCGKVGQVGFAGTGFKWMTVSQKFIGMPKPRPGGEMFDADKVGTSIVLRHWQPGDRFQPVGMQKPVKLQDLFINQKIPRWERHKLIVGAIRDGTLFWVEKLRISEQFKVTKDTIRRLHWQWKTL